MNWTSCDYYRRQLQKTARATMLAWWENQYDHPEMGQFEHQLRTTSLNDWNSVLDLWFPNVASKQISLILWETTRELWCLLWQRVREGRSQYFLCSFFPNFTLSDLRVDEGKLLFKEICYFFNGKCPHFAPPVIILTDVTEAAMPCVLPYVGHQHCSCSSLPSKVWLNLPLRLELNSNSWAVQGTKGCV